MIWELIKALCKALWNTLNVWWFTNNLENHLSYSYPQNHFSYLATWNLFLNFITCPFLLDPLTSFSCCLFSIFSPTTLWIFNADQDAYLLVYLEDIFTVIPKADSQIFIKQYSFTHSPFPKENLVTEVTRYDKCTFI